MCDHYRWSEYILKLFPIQTTDFYVDSSAQPPLPFFSSESVSKAFNVRYNSSFLSFVGPVNLTGRFNIDVSSIPSCKMSPGCSASTAGNTRRQGQQFGGGQQARVEAATKAALAKELRMPANPVQLKQRQRASSIPQYSKDYIAREETTFVSNVNGVVVGDDFCCLAGMAGVSGECTISTGKQNGPRYRDVTNQRDRFEDEVSGQTMVTIYNSSKGYGMDMLINITNGVETCQSFCPLLPGETLDPLVRRLWPSIVRHLNPHVLFDGVVSVPRCVPPYKYRTILEMLFKLIKFCELMGSRPLTQTQPTKALQCGPARKLSSLSGQTTTKSPSLVE